MTPPITRKTRSTTATTSVMGGNSSVPIPAEAPASQEGGSNSVPTPSPPVAPLPDTPTTSTKREGSLHSAVPPNTPSSSKRGSTASAGKDKETKVFEIMSREMFETIISDAGNKVILVEFMAQWCGSCRMIAAKLEELAELFEEKAIVIKIDVDDFEDLAVEYNVVSMPTILFLKNKQQLDLLVGSNMDVVKQSLEKYCGTTETK